MTIGFASATEGAPTSGTHSPELIEYSYRVSGQPPSSPGATTSETCWSATMIAEIVGASGTVPGATFSLNELALPFPRALIARSDTWYGVPFVRPGMVNEVIAAELGRSTHAPLFSEYW